PPVTNADGSTTLPGGGTVTMENGAKITAPEGTVIDKDGTVMMNSGMANIDLPGGTAISLPAGSTVSAAGSVHVGAGGASLGTNLRIAADTVILLDADVPLGYVVTSGHPFIDVKKSDWFDGNVTFVYVHGLFAGTGAITFSPDASMTRGMLVTVLGRLYGVDAGAYSANSFSDVQASWYYAPYVEWAKQAGIVSGVGDNKFAPDAEITRQDLAAILLRYANFSQKHFPATRQFVTFADDAQIADYAKISVQSLYNGGIISGKPNNIFDPRGNATRAEVTAMMHRFIEAAK
ncbi:MAG: S-layer homology domain-containing protein, partial [Syntrophomonadaceae bacterium]|nr:S-layer homology domain-containing protein [Syntrophomonadaceae bacterium]